MPKPDLAHVMERISWGYEMSTKKYPALCALVAAHLEEEPTAYATSHIFHHLLPPVAAIAMQCNAADHGGIMDKVVLEQATVELFLHTLKMAEGLRMTADQLMERVLLLLPHPSGTPTS